MPIEYEAKFLGIDPAEIRAKLEKAGYECVLPEFLFRRQIFDVPGFKPEEKWGRVRLEHNKINLNIKHTVDKLRVDGTHECEVNVPLSDNPVQQYLDAVEFMKACGLSPAGLHENKREIWVKGDVEICIDIWPGVRPYLEVEAEDEAQVRKACEELGLDFSTAMFGGITTVYDAELGLAPSEFVKIKTITFDEPVTVSVS